MSLRILTWNVQMITAVELLDGFGPVSDDEAQLRAFRAAAAIRAMPPMQRPDVVAFNEVFNEVGRRTLLDELRPDYPHQVDKIDFVGLGGGGLDLSQDSGLALVSRLPFDPIPDQFGPPGATTTLNAVTFTDAAGIDAMANKGAGLVKVSTPNGGVFVAFTHLQAYGEDDDQEHDDVRQRQLHAIEKLISFSQSEDEPTRWPYAVALVGDLNVKGNPRADGTDPREYAARFVTGDGAYGSTLVDGWRRWMPGEDIGCTQSEPARLDYHVVTVLSPHAPDRTMGVCQHQRVVHRGISDHAGLWGHFAPETPWCSPAGAVSAKDLPLVGRVIRLHSRQERVGAVRWVRFDEPGTYSWFGDIGETVEVAAYLARDISRPWPGYGDLVLEAGELGVGVAEMAHEISLAPKAHVIAVPEAPWFVKVSAVDPAHDDPDHWLDAGILRHTGTTPGDAIVLVPYADPVDPMLPSDKPLNADDTVWFRTVLPRTTTGAAYQGHFEVTNGTGREIKVALWRDPTGVPVLSTGGDQQLVSLDLPTSGGETVWLTITRGDITQTALRAGFRHGVSFLLDDVERPLNLQCLDETGADWLGDDEIVLTVTADGAAQVLKRSWDDVDTGDPQYFGQWLGAPVAFTGQLAVEVRETGDVDGDDVGTATIAALPDDQRRRVEGREIEVASGRYRFDYVLGRFPRGVASP